MKRILFSFGLATALLLMLFGVSLAQSSPTKTPTPVATTAAQKATVLKNANLRAGPGTTYAKVGSVKAGATAIIVGASPAKDWYKLDSGAWIAAFLVKPARPVPVLKVTATVTATQTTTVTVLSATATSPTSTPPSSASAPTDTPEPQIDMKVDTAGDWANIDQPHKGQLAEYWLNFWKKGGNKTSLSVAEMEACITAEVSKPDTPSTMLIMAISGRCIP